MALAALLILAGPLQEMKAGAEIDPKAVDVLQQMVDYLQGLQQFTFKATNGTDLTLKGNQKITLFASSQVSVKRPNLVKSRRLGELATVQMFYDGQTLTLYDPKGKHYAQQKIRQDLDGLIDYLRDSLVMDLPAADLFYADALQSLMGKAEAGTYIGTAELDGILCHHLAFRTDEVDIQLWVESGDKPLPRRYAVTSKWVTGSPVSTVRIYDWDLSPSLPDSIFQFVAPPNAKRIVFEKTSSDNEN